MVASGDGVIPWTKTFTGPVGLPKIILASTIKKKKGGGVPGKAGEEGGETEEEGDNSDWNKSGNNCERTLASVRSPEVWWVSIGNINDHTFVVFWVY